MNRKLSRGSSVGAPAFRPALARSDIAAAIFLVLLTATTLPAQQIPTPRLDGAEPAVSQRLASLQADLRANSGNGDAWGRYGMALEAHTFTDEAIVAYRHAHQLSPRTFRWPYLLAALIDERSAADGVPLYRAALALDPDYAPARVRFAEALERTGQFDAAEREYAQAARLDPANAHAHAGRGRLALAAGDPDAAIRHLSRARELAAENRSFAVTLAQAYARAGDRERGQQIAAAARSLGRINYRDDPIRSSVHDLALDARSYLRRANAHRVHGELDLARRELRAGIDVDASRPELHFALAEVLAASGDAAGSLAAARRAYELHAGLEGVAPFLARALFQTGDLSGALAMAEEALRLDAADVSMMLLVALVSAERGDVVRTVEILDRAHQARPRDPLTRDGLIQLLTNVGEAMVSSGLPDAAAEQFEKALDLAEEAESPEAAGLRRRLAQVRR
ncbi:MAG: tetratricopeptide repeat protein [Acidobacteriota bacterium]|nr:tetratricopeptide repeat protein [Acidobacteriota bacterium]MDE3265079.1 tetratricopeptide repeat protein [Acidobacteriota bacterium]